MTKTERALDHIRKRGTARSTEIGDACSGAKVNGKMVPLDYKLVNGDVVEIIIDRKRAKPNPDWLNFVITTTARREISKALKI